MALAIQAQGIAPAPITQQPPAAQTTQPLLFFPRMKENAVWAWTATVEKLETVGQNLKRLLLKVVDAIREFFAPKFESVKKAAVDLYERFTNKPVAAAAVAPVVKAPEAVVAPVVPKVAEEPQPAPAAQLFVPQPIEPIAQPAVEPPAQVQMPVAAVVIEAPVPAPVAAAAAAPAPVQAEPEKVGIFNFWHNWWK